MLLRKMLLKIFVPIQSLCIELEWIQSQPKSLKVFTQVCLKYISHFLATPKLWYYLRVSVEMNPGKKFCYSHLINLLVFFTFSHLWFHFHCAISHQALSFSNNPKPPSLRFFYPSQKKKNPENIRCLFHGCHINKKGLPCQLYIYFL